MVGRTTVTRTFLFTDLESSTRRWQDEGDTMGAALAAHDRCLEEAIERAGGTVVKHTGDGVLAVFDDARAALAAAVAGQRALDDADWGTATPLRVRMAVDAGPAEQRGDDYFGTTLNRAARLLGVTHARQVLCSGAVAELVADKPPDGIELVDLGEHRLRDLERAVRVFQVVAPGSPTEFPPLRSLTTARHNLPVIPNAFIGRDTDLDRLGSAVDEHPLVTLTGVGGAGKTRLALEFAARCVDAFPDGVFLVDLSTVSADAAVVGACADALELPASPGGGSERDQVLAALRHRGILLLLDNCEHVVDGTAGFAADVVTTSPEVRVVATSREPLGVAGEQIQPVRPLAAGEGDVAHTGDHGASGGPGRLAPAVELFADRAAAIRPDFAMSSAELAEVRRICERLDGLPLAIELAAARASHLSVSQIADRLDDRFRLLRGRGRRADRHATLRAAIGWSHDLLDDEHRRLLRRLAVFAGPFTLEAVEGVCFDDDERLDAVDLLGSLVDRSLVVADFDSTPPRYRLLETVLAFAEEELVAAGEAEQTRDRHARWFADELAPNIGRLLLDPDEWARVEPLYDNVRAAIGWSLDSGQVVRATRLLAGAQLLEPTAGMLSERRVWLRQVLDASETADHPDLRAACWAELATTSVMLADPDVLAMLQRATETEELPERAPLASVWAWRALVESTLAVTVPEFVDRTVASADRALEIVERWEADVAESAAVRSIVALAYLDLGRFDVVSELCRRSVEETADYAPPASMQAFILDGAYMARVVGSVAAFMTGDVEFAYELVRPVFDAVRANTMLGSVIAMIVAANGERDEAVALLRASLEAARRHAIPLVTAECLIGYGAVAGIDGEWETAARLLAAATAPGGGPDTSFAFRSPATAVMYFHFRDGVRSALGPEPARALRDEGRAMSHDEALALADPEAWATHSTAAADR